MARFINKQNLGCVGCKHDGGQQAYGSDCEGCSRNPYWEDCYEAAPKRPGALAQIMINLALHYTSTYNMKEVRVDVQEPNRCGPIFKVLLTAKNGNGQKVGSSVEINMHDIARNTPGGMLGINQAIEYHIRKAAEELLRFYKS